MKNPLNTTLICDFFKGARIAFITNIVDIIIIVC